MVKDVPADILIQRMQEFSKLWHKYMEIFDWALEASDEEITLEKEKEFRKIQVDIIRRATFLTLAVPNDIFDTGKDAKKLFTQTPSLYILKKEMPIQITTYRNIWHEVSIALNQKQGQLRHYFEEMEAPKKK